MEFANGKINFVPDDDAGMTVCGLTLHQALQIVDQTLVALEEEHSAAADRDAELRKNVQRYSGAMAPLPLPCEARATGERLFRMETLRQDLASLAMETL